MTYFSWEVSEWSRCSQTCGGGRKTRSVVCKQRISQEEEVILDDSECPGDRPVTERVCKRNKCPAMWVAEDWTEVQFAPTAVFRVYQNQLIHSLKSGM